MLEEEEEEEEHLNIQVNHPHQMVQYEILELLLEVDARIRKEILLGVAAMPSEKQALRKARELVQQAITEILCYR